MSNTSSENSSIIDGFVFANEAEAKQAAKEAAGVVYIRTKTNMDDPDMVLQIYNKMVQQKLFETAVGFTYLKELQEYLYSIPFIDRNSILPIYVVHPAIEQQMKQRAGMMPKQSLSQEKKEREMLSATGNARKKNGNQKVVQNVDFKQRFHIMTIVSIVLAVCVIGMFAITATSNNTTILNYENEIINRYAAWEQELNDRESVILEREQELGITQ